MTLTSRIRFLIYCIKQLPFACYSALQFYLLSAFRNARTQEELADLSLRIHLVTQIIKNSSKDVETVTLEQTQALLGGTQLPRKHEVGIRVTVMSDNPQAIECAVDSAVKAICPASIDHIYLSKSIYASCLAEWQGTRVSEANTYEAYLAGCSDKETVLLYFHGGGFMFGTEHGHRSLVARLQKRFGGRALSVRYRLSPQHPFPAALTDALTAYLFLIDPPAGAQHAPVSPARICLGGDSAGGNLALALYTVLVQQGRPLPAGLVLLSPWLDLTHSFPSCRSKQHDYLPPMYPAEAGSLLKQHRDSPGWPLRDRSRQVYTKDAMLLHPLVSPILLPELWQELGARPNVCIQTGSEEVLLDENRDFARAVTQVSACNSLTYDEFRSMPHVFQVFGGKHPSAVKSIDVMARFIQDASAGRLGGHAHLLRSLPDKQTPLYHDVRLLRVKTLEQKTAQMLQAVEEARANRERSTLASLRKARL